MRLFALCVLLRSLGRCVHKNQSQGPAEGKIRYKIQKKEKIETGNSYKENVGEGRWSSVGDYLPRMQFRIRVPQAFEREGARRLVRSAGLLELVNMAASGPLDLGNRATEEDGRLEALHSLPIEENKERTLPNPKKGHIIPAFQ
jgi:hypothetical protein